jgi:uncharacterized protein YdeI (YjbR/CyaY-like superfamily)
MAPVVLNPKKIRAFRSEAAFEAWLSANHARETEIWLRIYKKGTGRLTVTNARALDVALCWGWIDGIRKGFDNDSFLQRYTPRRARSIWSQINRDHVGRLTGAGRIKPPGQRQVDAAKADGRWDAAYAPIRAPTEASIPDDLRAAIEADPGARKTFQTLYVSAEAVFFGSADGSLVLRGKNAIVEGWRRYFDGPNAPFSWGERRSARIWHARDDDRPGTRRERQDYRPLQLDLASRT